MRKRIVRVQLYGPEQLPPESFPIPVVHRHERQSSMCLGQRVVELLRPRGGICDGRHEIDWADRAGGNQWRVRQRDRCMSLSERRLDANGLPEALDRFVYIGARSFVPEVAPAHVVLVGLRIDGPRSRETLQIGSREVATKVHGKFLCQFRAKLREFTPIPVLNGGPDPVAAGGVDDIRRDPEAAAGPRDRPLHHCFDTKLAGWNLVRRSARAPCDYAQVADPAKRYGEFLGDSMRHVVLARVTGEVLERKHGN